MMRIFRCRNANRNAHVGVQFLWFFSIWSYLVKSICLIIPSPYNSQKWMDGWSSLTNSVREINEGCSPSAELYLFWLSDISVNKNPQATIVLLLSPWITCGNSVQICNPITSYTQRVMLQSLSYDINAITLAPNHLLHLPSYRCQAA